MARVIYNDKLMKRSRNRLKRRLNSSFRSTMSCKVNKADKVIPSRRKRSVNKGKGKMVEMYIPVAQLVCGVCLSVGGEKKVRGTLSCCNHYFCFPCIVEWSKLESGCPICKQRFQTISKTPIGFSLRKAEKAVPNRDQVYRPSEEETDLSSSNTQSLSHRAPDNISVGSTSVAAVRETFNKDDTNSVPETPFSQLTGHSSPKTHSNGNSEDISSYPGSMAGTLSERLQTQRQMHQLLNDRIDQIAGFINPPGSQIRENALVSPQQASTQVGTSPQSICDQGRLPQYNTHSLNNTKAASSKLFSLVEQGFGNQASTSANLHKDASQYSMGKEQMQHMVKHHLKSLSRKMELGYDTFKDIARISTHTVLAAAGLEHRAREVYQLRRQSVICTHLEGSTNRVTCLKKAQCSSCFDRFVRNVVKEVLSFRVPECTKQTFQKE